METHREEPTLLESVVTSSCSRRHLTTQTAPLRRGYGTHIGYLWVGTPAQRVSVILDTGSHQLAFPCSGYFIVGLLVGSLASSSRSLQVVKIAAIILTLIGTSICPVLLPWIRVLVLNAAHWSKVTPKAAAGELSPSLMWFG